MSRTDLEAAVAALTAYRSDATEPWRYREWAGRAAQRIERILTPAPGDNFIPRRGDDVEIYLLAWRNRAPEGSPAQRAVETILADYERRAQLGVALDVVLPNGTRAQQ